MYQLQTSFNYSGELLEVAVKTRLFGIRKVRNWCGETNRAFMRSQAKRSGRLQSVDKALASEGFTWDTAPKSLILDKYWGMDATVLWKGYRLGIDITCLDEDSNLRKKIHTLNYAGYVDQTPIYDVDATAVWCLSEVPTAEWMVETLDDMIQQREFGVIYFGEHDD